jgi:hypothetical protein
VPGGAATVSTADFNGDGKPDLAVVWSGTSTSGVAILLGKGDGTFASEVSYPTGTYSSDATIADFNGDGNLDLAVVGESPGSLTILLGKGDGTFTTGETIAAVSVHSCTRKGGGLKLCPRIDLCFLGPPVALLTSCRLPPLG